MPSTKTLEKVAKKLGFKKVRQQASCLLQLDARAGVDAKQLK